MEFVKIVVCKRLQRDLSEVSDVTKTDCERCSLQRASFASEASSRDLANIENGLIPNKSLSQSESISFHNSAPAWLRRSLGSLFGLLAGLFLTLGSLLNGSVRSMSIMQTCSARSLFAALFLAPPLLLFKPTFSVDGRTRLELMALSAVFACKFLAFSWGSAHLPIAEFSLLANTVPIYTAAFGCILLRERCFKKALACAVVSAGVMTVLLPTILNDPDVGPFCMSSRAGGYASTLLSALANAIALVWLRRLGSVSALWVSLYASMASMMLAGIAAATFGSLTVPTVRDMALAAAAGICTLMQSYLPALACVLAEPSRVAISMTLAVAFSFVLQATVQRTQPSPFTCLGGFVLVTAIIGCHLHWDQIACGTRRQNKELTCSTTDKHEKGPLVIKSDQPSFSESKYRTRYGAVALIGSPDSCRLCSTCRLAT